MRGQLKYTQEPTQIHPVIGIQNVYIYCEFSCFIKMIGNIDISQSQIWWFIEISLTRFVFVSFITLFPETGSFEIFNLTKDDF